MSLVEKPYYMKRDCSPMCDHQMECARCGSPKCIKSMHHSRLYGYVCNCGSQEWKPVFEFSNQGSGLTKRAADGGDAPAKYVTMVNSLANMIIDAASKGYVSSDDLDYANDCLDKVIPHLKPRRR